MTGTSTRKPRSPKGAPQTPKVTDEAYKELLEIRLLAMHGFEDGTVDAATKNAARKAIRDARKMRSAEEKSGVLPAWRAYQEKLAAEKAAKPKRSRKAPAAKVTPEPEVVTENDPEPAAIAS